MSEFTLSCAPVSNHRVALHFLSKWDDLTGETTIVLTSDALLHILRVLIDAELVSSPATEAQLLRFRWTGDNSRVELWDPSEWERQTKDRIAIESDETLKVSEKGGRLTLSLRRRLIHAQAQAQLQKKEEEKEAAAAAARPIEQNGETSSNNNNTAERKKRDPSPPPPPKHGERLSYADRYVPPSSSSYSPSSEQQPERKRQRTEDERPRDRRSSADSRADDVRQRRRRRPSRRERSPEADRWRPSNNNRRHDYEMSYHAQPEPAPALVRHNGTQASYYVHLPPAYYDAEPRGTQQQQEQPEVDDGHPGDVHMANYQRHADLLEQFRRAIPSQPRRP
jgi:hypothetical protein